FDFFNISGALFVDRESESHIRASAQGLFMIMTNGLGAFVGGMASGWVVDHFTANNVKDWQSIWLTFAGYALLLGIVFPLVFKYRHDRQEMEHIPPALRACGRTARDRNVRGDYSDTLLGATVLIVYLVAVLDVIERVGGMLERVV